jgi:N,N-dimethylformamidase
VGNTTERTPEEKARIIDSALPGSLQCVPPLYPPPDMSVIQGFTNRLTASPGEPIEFKVSTPMENYDVRFYRMGKRSQEIEGINRLKGSLKSLTALPWEGCQWETDFEWMVPTGTPPAFYSAELSDASGSFHIPFVVKPSADKRSRVAVLASTNTWNAYNGWGGSSTYCADQPRVTSLDRPMDSARPAAKGRSHLVRGEGWILDWLQDAGYQPDLYGDLDLHQGWDWLREYPVLVISTHSEYWTLQMRDHLDAYLQAGGNLLYLSGNGLYWKVTFDDDLRVMEVCRDGRAHEQTGEKGGLWRNLGRTEHSVIGVGFIAEGYMTYAPYRTLKPDHWVFEGLDLQKNDLIGTEGLLGDGASGWEMDQVVPDWSPSNIEILAEGINPSDPMKAGLDARYPDPNYNWDGKGGAHMTYYVHPGGGGVFSAGSISFGASLAVDKGIQTIVSNVLNKFLD